MKIETGFDIARSPADAYAVLLDLERVTPCFPGAELLGHAADGAREVRVTVRLGPMRLTYEGQVRIADRDDEALGAVLAGPAREVRGGGSAAARIAMRVEEASGGARVSATADVDLTGRAAQMGRGIVEDVATRLVGEMAACLEAGLRAETAPAADGAVAGAPPPAPAAPLEGGRLMLDVARDRLRRPRALAAAGAALTLVVGLVAGLVLGIRRGRS
jgi:carbon monoxide dehydrogenase subunit G